MEELHPIPALNPDSLQKICLEYTLLWIKSIGRRVETSTAIASIKKAEFSDEDGEIDREHLRRLLSRCKKFEGSVYSCRKYLANFFSSALLDSMADQARRADDLGRPGDVFTFSCLCNERLGHLVGCHRDEENGRKRNDSDSSTDDEDDNEFVHVQSQQQQSNQGIAWDYVYVDAVEAKKARSIWSSLGPDLFRDSLRQLTSLCSLTLHIVCTNEILSIVADTCSILQVLDVSYSPRVTDIGLVYLCGPRALNYMLRGRPRAVTGCRYLRELYANPSPGSLKTFMPSVVACLLKNLSFLEVLDMEKLHDGIEHYYHNASVACSRIPMRMPAPLKLVHYTGSDKLAEVMAVCPKIRRFKLFVTESLPKMGATLQNCNNSLDHVTLVYSPRSHPTLVGLKEFLSACGGRISSLEIDCTTETLVRLSDLSAISEGCKFLDRLSFTSFRMAPDSLLEFPVPFAPLKLPFLTKLRLANIVVESFGKEVFRHLLGGCEDIERLYLSFADTAYFFSDFLIDDILQTNPLGRCEQLILKDVSLTLISALRLISSRPKLRSIGRLMKWDVEPSELDTFAQILRKANGMKLLQDINIV